MMGPRTARTRSLLVIMPHLLSLIGGAPSRCTCSRQPRVKQVDAQGDQKHGPISQDALERDDVRRVEQQQNAYENQQNGSTRKPRSLRVQVNQARKLVHGLSRAPL